MSTSRSKQIITLVLLVLLGVILLWVVSQCAHFGRGSRPGRGGGDRAARPTARRSHSPSGSAAQERVSASGAPVAAKGGETPAQERVSASGAPVAAKGGETPAQERAVANAEPEAGVADYAQLEIPRDPQGGGGGEVLRHSAYTVSYSRSMQQPRWVAYRLDRRELVKRVSRASRAFMPDPALEASTVSKADYSGSGYDLGHLAPAADMAFGERAMHESFYFTNVSPQLPNFNRGVWNRIEQYTRWLAERYDSVYVVTGPCFYSGSIDAIGDPPIPVASHFYKAYLVRDEAGWSGAALMVPHRRGLKRFESYWISLDSAERMTGLDLFPLLPDTVEVEVERCVRWEYW